MIAVLDKIKNIWIRGFCRWNELKTSQVFFFSLIHSFLRLKIFASVRGGGRSEKERENNPVLEEDGAAQ